MTTCRAGVSTTYYTVDLQAVMQYSIPFHDVIDVEIPPSQGVNSAMVYVLQYVQAPVLFAGGHEMYYSRNFYSIMRVVFPLLINHHE